MTLSEQLVDLARAAAGEHATEALRTCLLHDLAAAVGEEDLSGPIRDALADEAGSGAVALSLAVRMHARTQDDFYPAGRTHVGAVVIPAVLAVGTDDPEPALAAGYEVLTAVSEAYSVVAQERGYRPTGMFGPIGAAIAAGVALGLDDANLVSSIALASTMSSGTNQSWVDGSDEWLVEVGVASRAGVDAARMAGAGVHGSKRAVDGGAGWASAFFDDPGGNRLLAALRGERKRLPDVAIKPYPISGIAQVPTLLAAQLGMRTDHELPRSITVRMTPSELSYPGSRNRGPFRSRSDALMSIPRCVALAYLHGNVPYVSLSKPPDELEDRLIKRVELIAAPELSETEAELMVDVDGTTLRERGHGRDVLFPTWEQSSKDIAGIAGRSEAPTDVVRKIRDTVNSGCDVRLLLEILRSA